ncbi:response regulator transcription factor [Bacillus massilinigeriensis]|uniref:response regulator transcription factor n=1 Tax=Bacillus massilionigeriensis TaxID=1805475 RepID=UPI00096B2043|nr:response regulator transcription factor [Bacillus massilionigeriensis]
MEYSILLVEDDQEIALNIREYLLKRNFQVTWASTGLEGWDDFRNGSYSLAIIDLMLPEMDGFTLCQNIRWESDIPLLILSARSEEDDKVRGLKLGADDYLTKPFSLRELEARIESHLRRFNRYHSDDIPEKKLSFKGGLTIFSEKRIIKIHGNEVALTTKEFSIVYLLAKNPGRPFTKKEIYEHIWDANDLDGNNTVTVHMKSLRTKLGDSLKQPKFIQTVWGTGYRFIGEPI